MAAALCDGGIRRERGKTARACRNVSRQLHRVHSSWRQNFPQSARPQVSSGEDGHAKVEHKSTLTGHSKTVNCVRFSPDGARGKGRRMGESVRAWP